ncbi:tRNA wybutosine-synthesizing protein 2 [Colletotrichum tanaceti]|uniref:tRNA wybutosine-synthesizing protein 2 n=1 Tax=Colletotrichum tanaceti TaxID=1306861 RepID=A0A4U6XMT5_9PEZI|nr:tRNA wybutosine-synthesizing protein 2 [Colletotrichum tanaceti]TKW56982.1 tRNA wybutosine-synthesizing protein 2 [Colletotrichum tanaceti]
MTVPSNKPRGKKPKPENPISAATRAWLLSLPQQSRPWSSTSDELDTLLSQQTPKRFAVYEPMLLLPAGSFDKGLWRTILSHPDITDDKIHQLWDAILCEVSKTGSGTLTHLAVNEGIPLQTSVAGDDELTADKGENILRTPGGLKILHGDFGPSVNPARPSVEDFEAAFWVSTKQNGIYQTWAPRWTMFSRGNIKEKTRLLEFHSPAAPEAASHRRRPAAALRSYWAVDLYAGIGYFTFSYAKLGLKVLCWELNPWSVEALRRGAVANGWRVRVVHDADLELPAARLLGGDEQIVVFLQDNQKAAGRIADMRASGTAVDVLHVNGGLLPTSKPTWRAAWDMTAASRDDCWLHLHENVGTHEIESRRTEIQCLYDGWAAAAAATTEESRAATVEHVELVKTYAPDVWHCVFDVHITRSSSVT